MNVKQSANGFTGILVLNTVNLLVRTCLVGSNVAEHLRPRIPPSVPAPKIAELREGGLANIGVRIRPIVPLHPRSYFPLQLPVALFEVPSLFCPWLWARDPLPRAKAWAQRYLYQHVRPPPVHGTAHRCAGRTLCHDIWSHCRAG